MRAGKRSVSVAPMSDLPSRRTAGPRPILLLAMALVAALAVAVASHASPARAAGAPPCEPKLTRIGGKKAAVNCGPATVSLTVSGHTYRYTHGFCSDSKSNGAELDLTLGTLVVGAKGNAGEPYFSMLIAAKVGGSVFEADYGGKQVLGDSLIESSGKTKGAFKGTDIDTGAEFTGSWNCHGVIWHAP